MISCSSAFLALNLLAVTPIVMRVPPQADSIAARLKRAEAAASPGAAGEAAVELGRLFYARGEYRPAAEAFSRAAARLGPSRKGEALYWGGLSWLGLGSPNTARAALDEVVATHGPRRADAMLAIAAAWALEERYDKAFATLQELVAGDMGETGPAALAQLTATAERLNRSVDAERARGRLLAEYPKSMEAAALLAHPEAGAAAVPLNGVILLEAGRFTSAARAHGLLGRAKRSGFKGACVVEQGDALARSFVVRLGSYSDRLSAREAQARAAKELGLSTRITGKR